jgi:hypothetical protein
VLERLGYILQLVGLEPSIGSNREREIGLSMPETIRSTVAKNNREPKASFNVFGIDSD